MVPSLFGRLSVALFAITLVTGACSGVPLPAGAPTPNDPDGAPTSGAGNDPPTGPGAAGAPSVIEVGREYQHQLPADVTVPQISTFEVPPGSVVHVEASAAGGNGRSVGVTMTPPPGINLRADIAPGQSGSTRSWITSDESVGRWTLEVAGSGGDSVAFMVVAELQADAGAGGDAGAHAGTAVPVTTGEQLSGLLGDEDQEDWYSVPLEGGDVVTVNVEVQPDQQSGNSASIVYNGERLASTQVNPGGESTMVQVFAQDQTGVAQVQVAGRGTYAFTVEAGPQRDGGTDGDAGSDPSSAKRVQPGLIEGVLGGEDGTDHYLVSLPMDAFIQVEAKVEPDYLDRARIELLYAGTNVIREDVPPGATRNWLSALVNPAGAELLIRVTNGAGSYSLDISATPQPDGDGMGDASGDRAAAKPVTPSGSFDGVINNRGNLDSRDWYVFEATGTGTMVIELALDPASELRVRMQVMEGNRRVGDVSVGAGGSGTAEFDVTAGTTYEIDLGAAGTALYTITFR